LRFLPRKKGFGFSQKDGKETKERKGEGISSEELVYKVESKKNQQVCKVVKL